ncbi:MAG: ChuX/HutX family heme-like substrate-binding protein [Ahrensia sp.]|nr:ChuX/HutX family heme-like substrate-binding protein [Ahrensia sp.]
MTISIAPEQIRQAKEDHAKMRPRDLAKQLGISEAQYVAAWLGDGVQQITTDFDKIFPGLADVGEVMALTRNEYAVHEKIGIYDKYIAGKHAAMMLGANIDTRMFPSQWACGFAVKDKSGETVKHSLQFFDKHGEAIHKIHTRPTTNMYAWGKLVEALALDETAELPVFKEKQPDHKLYDPVPVDELRRRWTAMTDTHQFVNILRKLNIERLAAVSHVGEDFAWRVDASAVEAMMRLSASEKLPIMCFVGNDGCIQIHSGPLETINTMGPWVNIMDPTFHLHLRADKIAQVWAVRKPTDKGHVTSIEVYCAKGELIIQFFGKRIEGQDERQGWRMIIENLPRVRSKEAV